MRQHVSPVQQELHRRQQDRFSKTEAGAPWWVGTSPGGKVYEVFGARKGFTNRHAVAKVKERLPNVHGWAEKELGRYYGFSPISLLSDISDEDLVQDVAVVLSSQEPKEDGEFLLQVAQAMVDVFNVMNLDEL
jgi:hypothetical protein